MTTTLTRPNSSLLQLSWPILLELLLQILVGNVDQLMISHYSQPAVAAQIANRPLSALFRALVQPLLPDLAGCHHLNLMLPPQWSDLREALPMLDAAQAELLEANSQCMATLARLENLTIGTDVHAPKASASAVVEGCQVIVPLKGAVDLNGELARLDKELGKVNKELEIVNRKLASHWAHKWRTQSGWSLAASLSQLATESCT